MFGKHTHFPNRFANPVAAVFGHEKAAQPLVRNIFHLAFGVKAGAGLHRRDRVVQIGGKDLQRCLRRGLRGKFQPGHRDGIGLLAGGTAQRPDARRVFRPVFYEAGENLPLEHLEYFRIPEEARHVDQDILVKRLGLGRMFPQIGRVSGEARSLVQHHAPQDAPPDRKFGL